MHRVKTERNYTKILTATFHNGKKSVFFLPPQRTLSLLVNVSAGELGIPYAFIS